MSSKTQPSNAEIRAAHEKHERYEMESRNGKTDRRMSHIHRGILLQRLLEANKSWLIARTANTNNIAHLEELENKLEKAKCRVKELEARLELTPESNGHDGIYARDETIKWLDKRIDELEGVLDRINK